MSDEEEYFNDLVDFSCNEDNSSTSSYEIYINDTSTNNQENTKLNTKPNTTSHTTSNTTNVLNKTTFDSIFENDEKIKTNENTITKKYGLKSSLKPKPTPEQIQLPNKIIPDEQDKKKESKVEQQYEFDQTFIETFTKGLDPKKIFIRNSKFDDEVKIICLLLKYNYIPEYKCSVNKCRVRKNWNAKPIQLFLFRKNKNENDLTIDNLELRCPNCYLQEVGLNLFKKKKKESTKSCKICNYPMNGFSFFKQKEAICGLCSSKMSNLSYQQSQTQFYNELQETYASNPKLSDDFKRTEYYKQVGQFKSFDSSNSKNTNANKNKNKKKNDIKINMQDIPDIDDIVLE